MAIMRNKDYCIISQRLAKPLAKIVPRIPARTVYVLSKPVAILGDHPPIFG